jgi:uncharacterized protein (DUF1501 family)
MNRRSFLQAAAVLGLAVVAPPVAREARADNDRYDGPYWVFIHANGGWDTTYLCDPKGGAPGDLTTPNMLYTPDQIQKAGNIAYAPVNAMADDTLELFSNKRFFEAHHDKLCIVNGVNSQSVSHESGPRSIWTAKVEDGYPAFGAMVAATAAKGLSLPLAFQSNGGGCDATWDHVPVTRLAATTLHDIAYPNNNQVGTYHSPSAAKQMAELQRQRLEKMKAKGRLLPYTRASMGALYLARTGDNVLQRLAAEYDAVKPVTVLGLPDLAGMDQGKLYKLDQFQVMLEQLQLAVLGFKAGVSVSANIATGAFDTHNNHDATQVPEMIRVLRGVDYLLAAAKEAGILDKLYVAIGSDFGRPPHYNEGGGKDHWDVTSMMFLGPKIKGDRVVGTTDAGLKPIPVNPTTLAPDPAGVQITPQHVHQALRRVAGLDGGELAQLYPLATDNLALFG